VNAPLYIAKRYLFSKSSQNAINIITFITGLVVVIGAFSLFVVLAGFAGLKDFSVSFTNSFDPDLKAFPTEGKLIQFGPETEKKLKYIGGIASYSKIVEERAFFTYKEKSHVAYIRGVDANYGAVHQIDSMLTYGSWFAESTAQVVVGYGTANVLSLPLFDYDNPLKILVPRPGKGVVNSPKDAFIEQDVFPTGLYNINEELDKKYVFCDLSVAQSLLNLKPYQVTNIAFKLKPNAGEQQVVKELEDAFGHKITIKNRMQLNDALYKMLNTENLATYLIFTLIIIVAIFNVAGATIMMILDKKANLKTLYSMGATVREIRRIFFLHGTLLSVFGALLGIALATLLVFLQQQFSWVMITASLPYPVQFELQNFGIVFLTITVLGMIAAKIASRRISDKLLGL